MDIFFPKVKNRAMSRLLNACFSVLNIATSVCLLQTGSHLKNKHSSFIKQVPAVFQATARIFVQTAKFPPFISRK